MPTPLFETPSVYSVCTYLWVSSVDSWGFPSEGVQSLKEFEKFLSGNKSLLPGRNEYLMFQNW